MHLVFVYGTLKRGFPNYDKWMKPFKYIADGITQEKFQLIVGGPYYSPILLNELGEGHKICGEIFEVDDAGLKILDVLESIGKSNGYKRIATNAQYSNSPDILNVWIYVKNRTAVDQIHSELTNEYKLDERYIPVSQR